MTSETRIKSYTVPVHGWLGVGLVAICWPLNWLLSGLVIGTDPPIPTSHSGFFPLWLGYCLVVDALTFQRKGNSLLTRSSRSYLLLFVISSPSWWLFELINWRTQNWFYDGRDLFTDLQYAAFASVSFSTVIPAVFGTAELVSTFKWMQRPFSGPRLTMRLRTTVGMFILGWVMLSLLLYRPHYFFPFVWMSVHFILEPVNVWLNHKSLLTKTQSGNWQSIFSLATGCLICGFFWEMWNFYSYPKWIYRVPFVSFWKIFEMPLLGYGGYIPFAFEIHALYHLVVGLLKIESADDPPYFQLSSHNSGGNPHP